MTWNGLWPPESYDQLASWVKERAKKPIKIGAKALVFNFNPHAPDEEALQKLDPGIYVIYHGFPPAWQAIVSLLPPWLWSKSKLLQYDPGRGEYIVVPVLEWAPKHKHRKTQLEVESMVKASIGMWEGSKKLV